MNSGGDYPVILAESVSTIIVQHAKLVFVGEEHKFCDNPGEEDVENVNLLSVHFES